MATQNDAPASMRSDAAQFVDEERLWQRHLAIARHGATAAGGVNRLALSNADIAAQKTLIGWANELGLLVATDDAGNLFLRMTGADAALPPVMTGSHLDSQPTGGKFDGTYGVLAGLESLQAIRAAGLVPRRSIDVVAWMNEEGSRFAPGMMGSRVFTGAASLESILQIRDSDGVEVAHALADVRSALPPLPRWPLRRPVAAYLEAHIEQGPLLEQNGCSVGVVSGIQGKRTFAVTVVGEEAHVGTAPHRERKDALAAAVAMIHAMTAEFLGGGDSTRRDLVKVGRFDVKPNVPSVVPALVKFSIDLRHPNSDTLATLGDCVAALCFKHGAPCQIEVEELSTAMSLTFADAVRESIRTQARLQRISTMELLSSAGHDARYLHAICPTGMIFVPCRGGISHNETEAAEPGDLADGTRVLVETLLEFAS